MCWDTVEAFQTNNDGANQNMQTTLNTDIKPY